MTKNIPKEAMPKVPSPVGRKQGRVVQSHTKEAPHVKSDKKLGGQKSWADKVLASSSDPEIVKIKNSLEKAFQRLKIIKGWNDDERIAELSEQGLQCDIELIIGDLILYGKILKPILEELGRPGNPKIELKRLSEAGRAFIEAISGLHVKALSNFALAEKYLFGSVTQIHDQIAFIEKIIAVSNFALQNAPTSRGRPKKFIEQMITFDLSRYYFVLTGKAPNESEHKGSLHDLVSNVYKSLGITADVMAQIKIAISRRSERYADYAED